MSRRPRAARPGAVVTALILLASTGCGTDGVEPGPDAGTPACAQLASRLPARVLDRARADLDVTGAAAWGDPPIVLRCGVARAGPTSDPCLEVAGVDWTFSETEDEFRFVTHGRTPVVELTLPTSIDRTTASGALVDLATAVQPLPQTTRCT